MKYKCEVCVMTKQKVMQSKEVFKEQGLLEVQKENMEKIIKEAIIGLFH